MSDRVQNAVVLVIFAMTLFVLGVAMTLFARAEMWGFVWVDAFLVSFWVLVTVAWWKGFSGGAS